MLFTPLADVRAFFEEVTAQPHVSGDASVTLSKKQIGWLSVCITAMILMGLFCFAKI